MQVVLIKYDLAAKGIYINVPDDVSPRSEIVIESPKGIFVATVIPKRIVTRFARTF